MTSKSISLCLVAFLVVFYLTPCHGSWSVLFGQQESKPEAPDKRLEMVSSPIPRPKTGIKTPYHLSNRNRSKSKRKPVDRTPKGASKATAIRNDSSLNCFNTLTSGDVRNPFLAELLEAAESKQGVDKRIILTGGDGNYRGVVMNWMALMDNINVRDYIVLCFNKTLFDVVGSWKEGGHGVMVSGCISFQEMAFMKFIAMNVLVRAGYVTTWTDCDCLWLKDFFPQWIDPYASKVDMIGQRGNYPKRFVKLIGVAVCTGLLTFFPTANTLRIFDEVMALIPTFNVSNCDQLLLNTALQNLGTFNIPKLMPNGSNLDITVSSIPNAPVIAFLPFIPFMRSSNLGMWMKLAAGKGGSSMCIWHLQTPKYSEAKLERIDSVYLLALAPNWTNVRTRSDYSTVVNMTQVRYPPFPSGTKLKFIPKIGLQKSNYKLQNGVNYLDLTNYLDYAGSNTTSAYRYATFSDYVASRQKYEYYSKSQLAVDSEEQKYTRRVDSVRKGQRLQSIKTSKEEKSALRRNFDSRAK
jgi:hypothetical protein